MPRSLTAISTVSFSRVRVTSTSLRLDEYFSAFDSRFSRTCFNASASACTTAPSAGTRETLKPLLSSLTLWLSTICAVTSEASTARMT